jgi:hypothetical protein
VFSILNDGANDIVTALLALAVAAVLRALWSLQARITRLEGLDEMRERKLDIDRAEEPTSDPSLIIEASKED